MTTYRLMDGVAGRPGVGSSGTQPPAVATTYPPSPGTAAYVAGLVFHVTQMMWQTAYWWWVPGTHGNTAAQKCALWQATSSSGGVVLPAGTVTSSVLTAGAWNRIALPSPVPLVPFIPYVPATGFNSTNPNGFPSTQNQFGTTQPYAGGFSNGPLVAAANGASTSFNLPQSPFSVAGSDPSVTFPSTNDSNDLLWLDVEVTDQPPAGTSYRGFSLAPGGFGGSAQNLAYTLGMEFSLTQPCSLNRIWHYSPATAAILPSRCGIWDVLTQTEVAGTDNQAPSWSGAAGSGWVSCSYSGVTLQSGKNYKVSTFTSNNTAVWFAASANFWGGSPGLWSAGIGNNGPLVIPGNAAATSPGQDSWNQGTSWAYPATSTNPEFDGIDVEVTPVTSGSGLLMASII